jgi:hypothetical protein
MLKFKVGALLGFGIGWAVGSGKAAAFWEDIRKSAENRRASSGARGENTFERRLDETMEAADRTAASA